MQRDQKDSRRARLKQWRRSAPNTLSAHLFFGAMLIGLWRRGLNNTLIHLDFFWRHKFMQRLNGC